MRVTKVTIKLPERFDNASIRAFATIELDDQLCLRNVRVVESANGRFIVAMPSRRLFGREGEYHVDVAFPFDPALRERINDAVLRAYCVEARRALDAERPRPRATA